MNYLTEYATFESNFYYSIDREDFLEKIVNCNSKISEKTWSIIRPILIDNGYKNGGLKRKSSKKFYIDDDGDSEILKVSGIDIGKLSIYELEDEWYYVVINKREIGFSVSIPSHYKCDQLDGLIELLRKVEFIS